MNSFFFERSEENKVSLYTTTIYTLAENFKTANNSFARPFKIKSGFLTVKRTLACLSDQLGCNKTMCFHLSSVRRINTPFLDFTVAISTNRLYNHQLSHAKCLQVKVLSVLFSQTRLCQKYPFFSYFWESKFKSKILSSSTSLTFNKVVCDI